MKAICATVGVLGVVLLLLGVIAGDGGIWPTWAWITTSVSGLVLLQAAASGHKKIARGVGAPRSEKGNKIHTKYSTKGGRSQW